MDQKVGIKTLLAQNEAFLSDFLDQSHRQCLLLIKPQIVIGQTQSCDSEFGPISTLSP